MRLDDPALQACADRSPRHDKGAIPSRPSTRRRSAGVSIAPPADIRTGRHFDELGRVVGHREFKGRDVALVARVAIRVGSDHGLNIDQREIRIAQQQSPWTRGLRRTGAGAEQHYRQDSGSHGVALSVECVEANNLCAGSYHRACRLRYIAAATIRSNTDRACRRVSRTTTGRSRRPSCCSRGRSGGGGRHNRKSVACWPDVRGRARPGRNRSQHQRRRLRGSTR